MARLTLGRVHLIYVTSDVEALKYQVSQFVHHSEQLHGTLRSFQLIAAYSGSTESPNPPLTTTARALLHSIATEIHKLVNVRLASWQEIEQVVMYHMSTAEMEYLDTLKAKVTMLMSNFGLMSTEVNSVLASYNERISFDEAGGGGVEGREGCDPDLAEHRLTHYRADLEKVLNALEELEDAALGFKLVFNMAEDWEEEEGNGPPNDLNQKRMPLISEKRMEQRITTMYHRKEIKKFAAAVDGSLTRLRYWNITRSMPCFRGGQEIEEEELTKLVESSVEPRQRFQALCQEIEVYMKNCGDGIWDET